MTAPAAKALHRMMSPSTQSSSRYYGQSLKRPHHQVVNLPDGRRLGFAEYGDPKGRPLLYFHGYPSSRLEASVVDDMARRRHIRILALDRPGFGLSCAKPNRQIIDWPDDVAAFAKAQSIDKFAVMGLSGGGPYALACARLLPREMLAGVGLFASGPPWWPGRQEMSVYRRAMSWMANRWPWGLTMLLQGLVVATRWVLSTSLAQKRIDAWLQGKREKKEDDSKSERSNPERPISAARDDLIQMLIDEPFRQGSEAAVYEAKLLSADTWGFNFGNIEYEDMQIWHGAKDRNAPIALIRHMADRIPHCRFTELKDDTHYTMFQHMAGALDDLIPPRATSSTSKATSVFEGI